jgi:hypothetical protein
MIIKVKALGVTHEVDVERWATTFGTEATVSAVRADVLAYFRNVLATLGVWDEVAPQKEISP